jgi:hypothetical protein
LVEGAERFEVQEDDLLIRVTLLEVRVNLMSLAMKSFIGMLSAAFMGYLLTKVVT